MLKDQTLKKTTTLLFPESHAGNNFVSNGTGKMAILRRFSFKRMWFFAYCWKLPAYSGAFLLTFDNFSFCTYSWSFLLTVGAFLLTMEKCV